MVSNCWYTRAKPSVYTIYRSYFLNFFTCWYASSTKYTFIKISYYWRWQVIYFVNWFSPSYSTFITLNFIASVCNSQLPFLVHVKQSLWWLDNIKSSITLLASIICFECVCTTIPSSACWIQDVANPLLPSTSTIQILQSPISFISFR